MSISMMIIIYLFMLSVWDIRKKSLPVSLIILGVMAVFLRFVFRLIICGPSTELIRIVFTALLGALPGLIMTALSYCSDKVGRGDGYVLMIAGSFETCTFSACVICLACILLACVSGILLVMKKVTRKTRMAYIPFVAVSYMMLKFYEWSYLRI